MKPLLGETRIGRLRLTLESRYPGLVSVQDPRFVEQEVGYKRAAAAKVQELLSREIFADLLQKAAVDELVARCKRAANAGGNLLYLRHPSQGDLAPLELEESPKAGIVRDLAVPDDSGPLTTPRARANPLASAVLQRSRPHCFEGFAS